MANKIPVKARFTGADVTALGEFEADDVISPAFLGGSITNIYVDSGVADAYVLTKAATTPPITAYNNGAIYSFVVTNNNTGAATANIDGLGVKNIKQAGGADPDAAQITGRIDLIYDSGNDWFELSTKVDQAALNVKANIASPTFTGVPAAPTAAAGTNTTQIATTEFVAGLETRFCSAWVNFNGTGTVAIRGTPYNVASITDNGTGSYTVNFAVALANADYCPSINASSNYGVRAQAITAMFTITPWTESAPSVGGFSFVIGDDAGSQYDSKYNSVQVFGGQ